MPELRKPAILMIIDDSLFDLKINTIIANYTKLFSEVITFPAAQDAFDYLTANIHNTERIPQLILLDIQMPEMDGFEFINEYAKLPQKIRNHCLVAMLSSTDDIADMTRANASKHIIKLLKKPLSPDVLTKLVMEFFTEE